MLSGTHYAQNYASIIGWSLEKAEILNKHFKSVITVEDVGTMPDKGSSITLPYQTLMLRSMA